MPTTETDLYPPLKSFLEGQGYAVKGEIGRCDVVAVRGEEEPVVVEMKMRFSLDLVFQAVERFSLTDKVYVAIEHRKKSLWTRRSKDILRLCRRLGIGLLTVHLESGLVEPRLDPGTHQRACGQDEERAAASGVRQTGRRSDGRRVDEKTDHDRLSPGRPSLRSCPRRARTQKKSPSCAPQLMSIGRGESCCATSMAGSSGSSAVFTS